MIPSPFLTIEQVEDVRLKLSCPGRLAFSLVGFPDLSSQMKYDGAEVVSREYLRADERERFEQFSREKRRVEWLAGRIAAKHAACSLQGDDGGYHKPPWHEYHILTEKSGRPYLTPDKNLPEISISHSGSLALAMACTTGRCGIDLQEISEKILRVQKRFAFAEEIALFQQNSQMSQVDLGDFLTLLWSAKEALRKGINIAPVAGFLELQLMGISGDLENGLIFKILFSRAGSKMGAELYQTYQFLYDRSAVAISVSLALQGPSI